MLCPRVPTVASFSLSELEQDDEGRLGPRDSVKDLPFKKILKISVRNKQERPVLRSFGELSDGELNGAAGDAWPTGYFTEHKIKASRTGMSLVELMVLSGWERAAKKGLYRYDVSKYPTQTMPGTHGFLLQLNDGRATKKRTCEFKVDEVIQSYDETKFNFTKVAMEEVLFEFDTKTSKAVELNPGAVAGPSPNLVMINFCPIEYGHILLVPRVMDKLPQLIDPSVMRVAFEFCSAMDNPYFRMIYNSFGAYASVNHMHFQGYFMMAPIPSERCPTATIEGTVFDGKYVRAGALQNYPVRGWVLEMAAEFDQSLQPLADAVGRVCMKLQEMDVPFNMVTVDCGARVLLWPQCFQEKCAKGVIPEDIVDSNMLPAVSEVSGHIIVKRRKEFEEYNQDAVWRLLSLASMTEERFEELTTLCMKT